MWSLTELLRPLTPIIVCDIGAALGEPPSYRHLVETGAARIVGFDATPAECQRLNDTYGAPHRFYPYFIGDGGQHTFHETNWNLTGSLFEPNNELNDCFNNLAEMMQLVARHPVSTRRLDDVEGLDDIDFMKIDVQGAELMILQNAPQLLAKTLLVQAEVLFIHHYKNQPLFADVDTDLRGRGFQFHTFEGYGQRAFKPLGNSGNVSNAFRQIIWSDAVYVRDWLKLDLLPTEKLRKYAVLTHDLFGSFDLCHFILETLGRREGIDWAARYRERLNVAGTPPAGLALLPDAPTAISSNHSPGLVMENNLHIGGKEVKAGWKLLNIQGVEGADYIGDIRDLSQFGAGEFDKIYASHVLEHVGQADAQNTLNGIHRVLKDGGLVCISVPDLEVLSHIILNPIASADAKFHAMRMMFGGQVDAHDFHYFGWTYDFLETYLTQAGFKVIERVESFGLFDDTSDYKPHGFPISLNVIAQK